MDIKKDTNTDTNYTNACRYEKSNHIFYGLISHVLNIKSDQLQMIYK